MNIIPRFIIRRFLPGYLAAYFGALINTGSNNLLNTTHHPKEASLLIIATGIAGFIGMLYWAYKIDQQKS